MKVSLLRITLPVSLVGILLLLFIANLLTPKVINIGEIDHKFLDKKVKVQGIVTEIKTYQDSNFQIISIKDETGKIDVTTNRILNLTNNQNIIVIGVIKEYNRSLQIQADKIISQK